MDGWGLTMANLNRGEVEVTVGDKTFTLKLSRNAICEAETLLGATWPEILKASGSYITTRALLWAALRKYHPMSLLEVGDLIDDEDAEATMAAALEAVVKATWPKAVAAAEAAAHPPGPDQVGTGTTT